MESSPPLPGVPTNPEPVRVLEDPGLMCDILQRHLRTLRGDSYEIRDIQLVNLLRRDGSSGSAQ